MTIAAIRNIVQADPIDTGIGGSGLLAREPAGIAGDFTYPYVGEQLRIKDVVTPANNFRGDPASKLFYTSPSVKWTRRSNGLYAATNGSTELPYEWDVNGVPRGLLIEEARTNLCLQSNDFTNASWTKSNMTTAKTSTGPDGVANSASRLTASAANATALQGITNVSNNRITSMFVKRITGSGAINITHNNGTTWTVVTTTTAWTRVSNPATTAANPTVGVRIVTNGDAIDVWCFQHEVGVSASIAVPDPTSPIPTTTATVTRAVDAIGLATSAFPSLLGPASVFTDHIDGGNRTNSYHAAWTMYGTTVITNGIDIYVEASNSHWNYALYSSTVLQFNIDTAVLTARDGAFKSAFTWATNDAACSINGGAALASATVTTPPSFDFMYLGTTRNTGAAPEMNGYLKKFLCVPRRIANADLVAMTS